MVKPSLRKAMAQHAVANRHVSVRLACAAFGISETCYRYQGALNDENAKIAKWLTDLTDDESDWGFGQCFYFLRNVKGFGWNHKRVYRIYCELALNLRIKPRRRTIEAQCSRTIERTDEGKPSLVCGFYA